MKIKSSGFKRLIGVWKTSGKVMTEKGVVELSGTDSYELVLEGNYILHRANVTMGNEKSETIEMISLESSTGTANMQYFNSKGESGSMEGEINDNDFTIEGNGLKFGGSINDNNSEITGKWFVQDK